MKINKQSSNKKIIIFSVIIVSLIACVCVALFIQTRNSNDTDESTSTGKVTKNTDSKKDTHENHNKTGEDSSANVPADPSTPNDTPDTQPQNPNYVEAPLLNPPSIDDPYPIENERYRIAQAGEKSFNITLYPIANNPEFSDYNAQLKAYKNEVLTYLKKRYGSTNNLTINWSPIDAANL